MSKPGSPTAETHKCTKCNSNFTTKDEMTNHMKTHKEQERHECAICKFSFTTNDSMTNHMRTHKTAEYNCATCRSSFQTKVEMTNHMKTHKEQERHECVVCRLSFTTKDLMTNHMKTHKAAEYNCATCRSSFRTEVEMTNHIKTHKPKEKNCATCRSGFPSEVEMTNHIKTHGEGLDNMSDLQRAAASINIGIPCKTCRKDFSSMAELRSHRKTEHPTFRPCRNFPGTSEEDRCKYGDQCDWKHIILSEGTHLCWNCGNKFPSIYNLNFHRKQTHDNMGLCKQFNLPGGCTRGEDYCQFRHVIQTQPERAQAMTAQPQLGGAPTNGAQDFQRVPQNTAPTNNKTMNHSEKRSIMEMMRPIMTQQQTMNQQIMTMLSS